MSDTIYYGIADKFLLDNKTDKENKILNTGLVYFGSESVEELLNKINQSEKKNIKLAISRWKTESQEVKEQETFQGYMKNYLASKYIVSFKVEGNYLIILKKEKFNSDEVDKYMVLV